MDTDFTATPQFYEACCKEFTSPIRRALVVGYVEYDHTRREGFEWRALVYSTNPDMTVGTEDMGGYASRELAEAALARIVTNALNR